MYEISDISTNLFKMYEHPMYCKMLGVGRRSILTKKNVCKSLVEPRCMILARFSIFSIQLRFIVQVQSQTCTRVLVRRTEYLYPYLYILVLVQVSHLYLVPVIIIDRVLYSYLRFAENARRYDLYLWNFMSTFLMVMSTFSKGWELSLKCTRTRT